MISRSRFISRSIPEYNGSNHYYGDPKYSNFTKSPVTLPVINERDYIDTISGYSLLYEKGNKGRQGEMKEMKGDEAKGEYKITNKSRNGNREGFSVLRSDERIEINERNERNGESNGSNGSNGRKGGRDSNENDINTESDKSDWWLTIYFNCIHVMAATYDKKNKKAGKCFYTMLSEIMPTVNTKKLMKDFIEMPSTVSDILLSFTRKGGKEMGKGAGEELGKFLKKEKEITNALKRENFLDYCLEDSEKLLKWTYLLRCYFSIMSRGLGEEISYEDLESNFTKSKISKETWGNPTWFVIHFSSMYSPDPFNEEWALSYKAFMACLMFMIPCPICREHLRENLPKIHIDDYLYSRDSIFEWSVKLHNIVNASINKPIISLLEARQIYNRDENSYEKIGY